MYECVAQGAVVDDKIISHLAAAVVQELFRCTLLAMNVIIYMQSSVIARLSRDHA